MKYSYLILIGFAFALSGASTAPATSGEQLNYNVNWPSGLSLGETRLSAGSSKASGADRFHFDFHIDAAVPGFQVADQYSSASSADYCSVEFDKKIHHGSKRTDEKTTFDQQAGNAERETKGGGKTQISTSSCAKDALTYLYFVRQELMQGRMPPPQTVYFGAPYQVRLDFAGTQSIHLGDRVVDADRLNATAKGQSSDVSFEVYFLKDAVHTPALVRVPFSVGAITMELVK